MVSKYLSDKPEYRLDANKPYTITIMHDLFMR